MTSSKTLFWLALPPPFRVISVRSCAAFGAIEPLIAVVKPTGRMAACPDCGRNAQRVHSRYTRTLNDISVRSQPIVLQVLFRRFVCRNRRCPHRILLDHLPSLAAYVPLDISREHLCRSAGRLAAEYPGLPVHPVCADYTAPFRLPTFDCADARWAVYFPGSTIGNFHPHEAVPFLRHIARVVGPGGGLLIGVDLKKDTRVLETAYNDRRGVTAAFNLNLLRRINRDLGADFDLEQFGNVAFYNEGHGRVEMHLLSLADQTVRSDGAEASLQQWAGVIGALGAQAIGQEVRSKEWGVAQFLEPLQHGGFYN